VSIKKQGAVGFTGEPERARRPSRWKRTRWHLLEAAAFTLAASAIITAPVALGKQERALMKTNDWKKGGREGVHSVHSYGNH